MPAQFYMADEIQQHYYNKIKSKNSLENDVDHFWHNLLPDYFQKKLKFGIERESRPLPGVTKQRADWIISYIRNGGPKAVVATKDKRGGLETKSSDWQQGLDQLTAYLCLVRTEGDPNSARILYGVVNISTYTRFYELHPEDATCVDYPATGGRHLELVEDEAAIHQVLTELVEKTRH